MSKVETTLTAAELAYYGRQIALPEVGHAGQERLKSSSVLLIGLGGLGSPLSLYLAAAGVGRIGIVEFDKIESSNLHRQILYGSSAVGEAKLAVGARRLHDLNPHIQIEAHAVRFDRDNARELVRLYDVVADGADNFATRYLVNDACVLEDKPLVSASILGFEGQLSVFHYQNGPCYRCVYPEAPPPGTAPSCAEGGVLGALPGILGSLQAAETLKVLLGIGEPASGKLLHFNALSFEFHELRIVRDRKCLACGEHPGLHELGGYAPYCNSARATYSHVGEISPTELAKRLRAGDKPLLLDVREDFEREICVINPSLHRKLSDILAHGFTDAAKTTEIVAYCKSGARSRHAAEALTAAGFKHVKNLTGGILRWIDEVDPTQTKY